MATHKPRFSESTFVGDINVAVARVQRETFGELVGFLYTYAKERYLEAVRLLGKDDELSLRIKGMPGFDPSVLKDAHDRIAAYFSLTRSDLSQVPAQASPEESREAVAREWRSYFHTEARHLAQDDQVARAILSAVALQHTEAGMRSESALMTRLRERYPLPDLPAN